MPKKKTDIWTKKKGKKDFTPKEGRTAEEFYKYTEIGRLASRPRRSGKVRGTRR
jgi:hypothetical protein